MIKVIFLALAMISTDVYSQKTSLDIVGIENHSYNLDVIIKNLHIKKFKWITEKNLDSLTTLLHDDVHYIHSNGWKETKTEMIHNIASGKLKYSDIVVHDSEVRVIENTAIVTGKGTFFVSMDDKPIEINLYYTEVYSIMPEGIKLVSRHACKY